MSALLQSVKRPPAMGEGSRIAVITLASAAEREQLYAGCAALQELTGYEVECCDVAATPAERAAQLMQLWKRKNVGAIVCARGGYGSNYLLPLLDFEAMRKSPRAFVGYSDNTALLIALERAGIACFHGPMAASDFSSVERIDFDSFFSTLEGDALDFHFDGVCCLQAGEAEGPITGGCLSIVVTTLGTPWEIETAGKLLFLEDVNERVFRIDRMLRHLLLAGKFEGVRGVIFGAMTGCTAAEGEEPLHEMLRRLLAPLGVPIVVGFPSGHVEGANFTLPFGVPATLRVSAEAVTLKVEAATASRD